MLTFEEFESAIEVIKSYTESDEKLSDALRVDGVLTYSCEATSCISLFLAKMLNDRGEWIDYWLWELNFGKNFVLGDVEVNGQEIDLSTARNLYDFLKT